MSVGTTQPIATVERAASAKTPASGASNLAAGMLWPLLSGAIGLALWEGLVRVFEVPVFILPAPSQVIVTIVEQWWYLLSQLAITTFAAGLGLIMAVVFGLAAGAAITASRLVDRMLTPWLVIAHAVPKVVIAPLFLVWFGFGLQSEMFFVVAFTFFPVIVNTVTGLKSADPEQILMVRAMGATPTQVLRKIQFPSALPSICAGIKLAVTLAPVGAVIGEFVASNKGLGHLLIRAVGDMDTPLAFAAVTVFSIFGVLLWRLAEWGERRVLPWHPSQREAFLRGAGT
ncbi:MAG: NitT/TauT family transport system permease protein [Rhodospirillaceae bacterium]|nr:NitT/TauT family transport system permease protein [Rhodospirillaceae bacterium]